MHRSKLRPCAGRRAPGLAVAAAVAALQAVPAVFAAPVHINNEAQVPRWSQRHDFREIYRDRETDMRNAANTGWLGFSQLAGDARVRFDNNAAGNRTSEYRLRDPANPGNTTDFADTDYYTGNRNGNNLAGGGWHCAPAATAMWVEWLRANRLGRLGNRGGEVASITGFAEAADTSDVNRTLHAGDELGHLGTSRTDMVAAANAYVRQGYPGLLNAVFGPRISAWTYSAGGYQHLIDRSNPPVVFYQNVGSAGGHVVVGIGYDGNDALVVDPWTATVRTKNMANITDIGGGGAGVHYGNGEPQSAAFDRDWTGARLQVMDISDWGDAPSSYLFNRPAGHLSGDREWLGSVVTGEVDPFSRNDDPDGVANVGDHDRGDDGIVFTDLDPSDQLGALRAAVSSVSGMALDPLFETDLAPSLYLNGWIDWNRDTVWDASEQIVDLTLPADFDGTRSFDLAFFIPAGAMGEYWARFRLDRGEDVGPYGFARFGEVEDWRITIHATPEPSVITLLAGVALAMPLLRGRRRRH